MIKIVLGTNMAINFIGTVENNKESLKDKTVVALI